MSELKVGCEIDGLLEQGETKRQGGGKFRSPWADSCWPWAEN